MWNLLYWALWQYKINSLKHTVTVWAVGPSCSFSEKPSTTLLKHRDLTRPLLSNSALWANWEALDIKYFPLVWYVCSLWNKNNFVSLSFLELSVFSIYFLPPSHVYTSHDYVALKFVYKRRGTGTLFKLHFNPSLPRPSEKLRWHLNGKKTQHVHHFCYRGNRV